MEKPEIKVDEWCTGPQGMRFELFPIRDVHLQSDVELVKEQLYRDRDVVQIRTTWLRKETK
jgi:hypothetical protein